MAEVKTVEIGDIVVFTDPARAQHLALVTAVWGDKEYLVPGDPRQPAPSVNLVMVSTDVKETDSYGRQIKRETSVVHSQNQPAPGMFWRERG
jgi:hypothetical protein